MFYRIKWKIEHSWMKIKHAYQRVTRGYDDTAYWGLDGYITDIALPVLKHYRAGGKMGTPYIDEKGDFDEKAWQEILDKMILAFEILRNEDYMEGKHYEEVYGSGTYNQKAHERQMKQVDEGLALFAKYFRALWD